MSTLNSRRALVLGIVILIIVLVSATYYAHATLGLSAVVVDGKSMLPTLQTGDIVFIISPKDANITVGDVVVYRYTGYFYGYYLYNALIIHRVIYIYHHDGIECLVTKGDNNLVPDPGYPSVCGYVTITINETQTPGGPVGYATEGPGSAVAGEVRVSGVPINYVIGVVIGGSRPIAIPYIGSLSLILRPVKGPT